MIKNCFTQYHFTAACHCYAVRALAVWQVWQLPYQYFGILPHQNSFYKLIFNQIGKAQRSVAGDL